MTPTRALIPPPQLSHENSLKTLVENRTVYTLDACELNLFETYENSHLVPLRFSDFVVTSMLRGKKIMHLFDDPAFEYLPGETVVIPSNVEMKIDFPEAEFQNPTQCLALAIDQQKIDRTIELLNERYPKEGSSMWQLDHQNYFFYNNIELAATIGKLINECMSTSVAKDILADLTLQELLIRIIQTQTAKSLERDHLSDNHHPIAQVVEFIRSNIRESLTLKILSDRACMSASSFYRVFKRETGMSPIDFVLHEKIRHAKKLLRDPYLQVNEVGYMAGFDDPNYFIRLFKKQEGITPKQFQALNVG
ncbi:AraC family transcriptional regulator [Flavobacterium sp. HJ-32-4]|nr:AraC family transcriptional regulator [Flavobacterium sp. HJ-32-4]UMY64709.1 AraC family transcriptional regulator [Flavobacterium sp. HJ-32-4]